MHARSLATLCIVRPIRSKYRKITPRLPSERVSYSPLGQGQQVIPLVTFIDVGVDTEPARRAIFAFPVAGTDGVSDHFPAGGGRDQLGLSCEAAGDHDLRGIVGGGVAERTRGESSGGRSTQAGAQGGEESRHDICGWGDDMGV